MKQSSFFSKEMFTKVTWGVAAISILYILINLFVIGGDGLSITLTDTLPIPLSIATTIVAFILWKKFAPKSSGAGMWRWFTLGWGLWALGEILYVVYAAISEEVPYPCWADAAYIVGYIFLVAALVSRVAETPMKFNFRRGVLLILVSALFVILAVVFVIVPLIQNREPGNFIVNVLDVLYPTLDLVLLLLATRLLFDFLTRGSSTGWVLLIVGFILMTIADLMYSYTNSFGLYYPDDRVNLITTLGFALPYNLAYAFWILGIYRLQVTDQKDAPELAVSQPEPVENTHVVMFVNRDMSIDEVSANFTPLTGRTITTGTDLGRALGITGEEVQAIRMELAKNSKIGDRPLQLRKSGNATLPAKLNAIELVDPQGNVTGAILVVRALAEIGDLDHKLSEFQLSIARQVRIKSGSSEEREATRFLCGYYLPVIRHLESMVYRYGGTQQGVVFQEMLNRTAAENGWDVKVEADALVAGENSSPAKILKALWGLVSFAKSHLERMADKNRIENELDQARNRFTDTTRGNLRYIEDTYKE